MTCNFNDYSILNCHYYIIKLSYLLRLIKNQIIIWYFLYFQILKLTELVAQNTILI